LRQATESDFAAPAMTLLERLPPRLQRVNWRAVSVHGSLVSAQCLFSSVQVVSKIAIEYVFPIRFTAYRTTIAGLFLMAVAFVLEAKMDYRRLKIPSRDLVYRLIAAAICGFVIISVLFIEGLDMSSPAQAGLFQPSQALFTMLISVKLGYEKWSWWKGLGLLIAFSGIVLKELGPSMFLGDHAKASFLAGFLFLCNSMGSSVYTVLVKQIIAHVPPLTITAWALLIATPINWVISFFFTQRAPMGEWPTSVWLAFLFAGTIAGALPFSLMNYANKHSLPSVVTLYVNVQPVTSALFGWWILGDLIGAFDVMGGFLIILGVMTVLLVKYLEQKKQKELAAKSLDDASTIPPSQLFARSDEEGIEMTTSQQDLSAALAEADAAEAGLSSPTPDFGGSASPELSGRIIEGEETSLESSSEVDLESADHEGR